MFSVVSLTRLLSLLKIFLCERYIRVFYCQYLTFILFIFIYISVHMCIDHILEMWHAYFTYCIFVFALKIWLKFHQPMPNWIFEMFLNSFPLKANCGVFGYFNTKLFWIALGKTTHTVISFVNTNNYGRDGKGGRLLLNCKYHTDTRDWVECLCVCVCVAWKNVNY